MTSLKLSDLTKEEKISILFELIDSFKNDEKILPQIINKCIINLDDTNSKGTNKKNHKSGYGGHINKIDKWMESRFEKNPELTPSFVEFEFRKYYKISSKSPYLLTLAKKVKNRVRMRIKRGKINPKQNPPHKNHFQKNSIIITKKQFTDPQNFKIIEFLVESSQVDEMIRKQPFDKYGMELWNNHIADIKDILIKLDLYGVVYALFRTLMEFGDCPSILDNPKYDRESSDLLQFKDIFMRINLRSHIFRVIDIWLLNEKDYDIKPQIIPIALAYDISKIYRGEDKFSKIDHSKLSLNIFKLLVERTKNKFEFLYDVILSHHEIPESSFGEMLKKYDGLARQEEMSLQTGRLTYRSLKEWFDLNRYINAIKEVINEYIDGNIGAFTHGSNLYVTPDFLMWAARKLAEELNVFYIHLYRESDKRMVLLEIVKILKENNFISYNIPDGSYGKYYKIILVKKDRPIYKRYLLPLKIEIFDMPSEFEKKKKGFLKIIELIKPVRY